MPKSGKKPNANNQGLFKKVLIANRGEIALRIHRACKEMGIQTVAVYSEADREAMHVKLADESVCIGPNSATDSYLNIPAIISACEITDADAVHPGYGFLSENARFAEIVEAHGMAFIGPTAEHIRIMGDKITAKDTVMAAGIPVVPGSDGSVTTYAEAKEVAKQVGFPLLVKAAAGGGGRGMRLAETADKLEDALSAAQQEAIAAFGNGEVYLERYLTGGRHIEIQVLADTHGNVVHLGERDCSLQRRNQKVLEEAPSPTPVPPYYDSLIGKLIVWGHTREGALLRLRRALGEMVIEGIQTTIPLHQALLDDPDFQAGDYNIHWLEKWLEAQG